MPINNVIKTDQWRTALLIRPLRRLSCPVTSSFGASNNNNNNINNNTIIYKVHVIGIRQIAERGGSAGRIAIGQF